MPVAPDHSGNLPSEFLPCPKCGKRGIYKLRPSGVKVDGEFVVTFYGGLRCKYCQWSTAFQKVYVPPNAGHLMQ